MLANLSEQIRDCLQHAEECAKSRRSIRSRTTRRLSPIREALAYFGAKHGVRRKAGYLYEK